MKTAIYLGLLGLALPVIADDAHHRHNHNPNTASPSGWVSAEGNIRELAPADQRITIYHKPVPALNWPAMEMDFRLADPALVDGLSIGDPVHFQFTPDSPYQVQQIAPAE